MRLALNDRKELLDAGGVEELRGELAHEELDSGAVAAREELQRRAQAAEFERGE
jgi:hypothetical protein